MFRTHHTALGISYAHPLRSALLMLTLLIGLIAFPFLAQAQDGQGTTYYVDCQAGSDSNNGTSQQSAFKTVLAAANRTFSAGDSLLVKSGCTFTGQSVNLKGSGTSTSPIYVGKYGTGSTPILNFGGGENVITLTGSYFHIEDLDIRGVSSPTSQSGKYSCTSVRQGFQVGIRLMPSANNNQIAKVTASGLYAGIFIDHDSNKNKVLSSSFTNNNMMTIKSGGDDDSGAFGILLWGNDNEIAGNSFSGNIACSPDYGQDGSSVEIYNGSRNNIHHNTSVGDNGFSELGKDPTATSQDNVYAFNLYSSSTPGASFLVTRGPGNFGPIERTTAVNNTVYITGAQSPGAVVCDRCESTSLTLKNNILWGDTKALYTSSAINDANNIYWSTNGSPLVQGPVNNPKKVNPGWVAPGSNYQLTSSSPARDAGVDVSSLGYSVDLKNAPVPATGTAFDIGAYEFGSEAPPVTQPPLPPVTDPPVTDPPVTDPPVTQPPLPPVTDPPATDPPLTDPPITQPSLPPVTNPPATNAPVTTDVPVVTQVIPAPAASTPSVSIVDTVTSPSFPATTSDVLVKGVQTQRTATSSTLPFTGNSSGFLIWISLVLLTGGYVAHSAMTYTRQRSRSY